MSRRRLDWRQGLADLKADRLTRPAIREERLRAAGGAKLRLSCWRGRSGRRYVVTVHAASEAPTEPGLGLALAVSRDAAGIAALIAVDLLGGRPAAGATELHVWRLADSEAERDAALADLTEA